MGDAVSASSIPLTTLYSHAATAEVLNDGGQHRLGPEHGTLGVLARRLRPVPGIAGFDSPDGQISKMRVLFLHPPADGEQVPQRIESCRKGTRCPPARALL